MSEPRSLSKQQMFEAEMANQNLERIQQFLQQLDKQVAEVLAMKEALTGFGTLADNDEMLVPMAAGVFMKARATGDRTLLVNVGNNVIVPKDIPGVQAMLDEQLSEMRQYQDQLHKEFDEGLIRLQEIERSMR